MTRQYNACSTRVFGSKTGCPVALSGAVWALADLLTGVLRPTTAILESSTVRAEANFG